LARGEVLHTHDRMFYVGFKNLTVTSSECPPNRANVSETGITLPGRSEVSQAAATPCRQELCKMIGNSGSKQPVAVAAGTVVMRSVSCNP